MRVWAIDRYPDWTDARDQERFAAPLLWVTGTVSYPSAGGKRIAYTARALTAAQNNRIMAAASELQPASRALRTWSDSTAAFKTDGVLERLAGSKVTIRKPDGTRIEIPLYKLSKADRSFVEISLGTATE